MFGFMRVSKHEAEMRLYRANVQNDREADQRAITGYRLGAAILRAEVAELRPLAEKWKSKMERDRVYHADKRRVAK